MHQSFESSTAPPPPIRALAGDGGGGAFTSDILHVGSPEGGTNNSLEVMVFASPTKGISGAVTPWSVVFIFVPHSNFAFIIVALIVHILQSVLTIKFYKYLSVFGISLTNIFICYCGMYIWTGLI